MPGFDGSGPQGQGARTGRQQGRCGRMAPSEQAFQAGRGGGVGGGQGRQQLRGPGGATRCGGGFGRRNGNNR
ncbi:DUF5320 domain-containing protein [Desulfogranum mediterraneum]|uniref:DUF5320 domain-containing protein n=1 Tax=Desulfogranum mediterraneum TaxID=160661 RepID=UPI001294793A|nr:DUF5320 domain-containing protein [Desulfogranum mediterraneum]